MVQHETFGLKQKKTLLKRQFSKSRFFIFLQNGQNKIGKNGDFLASALNTSGIQSLDRPPPHAYGRTTLKFRFLMGILKFSDPMYRGSNVIFHQIQNFP